MQPPEVCCKDVLRNFAKFTGKYLCHRLFFNKVAEVFACKFCEISKNTFFAEHLRATASLYISKNRTYFQESFHRYIFISAPP